MVMAWGGFVGGCKFKSQLGQNLMYPKIKSRSNDDFLDFLIGLLDPQPYISLCMKSWSLELFKKYF